MASYSLKVNGTRPSNVRHPTAPGMMMNSHFANVGEDADKEAYEHGVQVIDEDKVFKYGPFRELEKYATNRLRNTVQILQSTSASRM